jgi:hypothetical protein
MNGKFLLDTNAFILLTKESFIFKEIKKESQFYVSIITELELLSYSKLKKKEEDLIQKILVDTSVILIDSEIKKKSIELRRKYKLKLPDAIIAGTSLSQKFPLVTNDKIFSRI